MFLISFLVFSVIKLPAAVALNLAKPYLPEGLEMGQTVGTVWQGQMMQVRFGSEQLNNVRWDISGWSLFSAKVITNLRFGDPRDRSNVSGNADIQYNMLSNELKLTNTVLRSSVEQVIKRIQLPLPVLAKGRVILELDEYVSGTPYCGALKGELVSPNIDVQGVNGWFSIGDLTGSLNCKSGDIAIVIEPNNKLGLEADATLKAGFDFTVAGYVKPDVTLPQDVHNAVKFLGRPDNQGRYSLSF